MNDRETAYEDKLLVCQDCGVEFTFTTGEQAFFNSKIPPLTQPKRCAACRLRRKQTIRPPVDYDTARRGTNYQGVME